MDRTDRPLDAALATLRSRWGNAAIRLGNGEEPGAGPRIHGALALVPAPLGEPLAPPPDPLAPALPEGLPTGFPDLDALLGRGGLPREGSAAIRGDLSSGKTTLALRCVAEAQARGSLAAWLDLPRAFDPVEAVARGVDLDPLLVIRPGDAAEGFAIAGSLLAGRAVDLLVADLPARLPERATDALRRLSAHARRIGARLLVLEPASAGPAGSGAPAESAVLRLELERSGWIRVGRDVVGQRTRVTIAKDRRGAPGRAVDLEIHYLPDGERALHAGRPA